uniref:HECT-type E3 ubiquitin transferase n=1 Tax=Ditylenchus dipsaci TaxID=166011 RepID=A0A915D6C7_9BILA
MEDTAFATMTHPPKNFVEKRNFFYQEIRKLDDHSRHEDLSIRIRRGHLFSDSYRELFRIKNSEWRAPFSIIFEEEVGQDAGTLLRMWYSIIIREAFDPGYALFRAASSNRLSYTIAKQSCVNIDHLSYFKFIGRVIAKAIYDNNQLDCHFTRAFYKHILNLPVGYQDMESEDPSYFKSLELLLNNPIEDLGTKLTFSVEMEHFGLRSMQDLKDNGCNLLVTDDNKEEFVQLACQMKMTGYHPQNLISIFNEQELELLICGLPEIDIEDLYNNTEYKNCTSSSPQIQWFWQALRSFDHEDLAKFLQFVTGTCKVPLHGFSHLKGMNGAQIFTIHIDSTLSDCRPHTCLNQLDLPQYKSYEQLNKMLLLAIRGCSEE